MMWMLAQCNPVVEKAVYDTVEKMPPASALELLVLLGLSLIWMLQKR